MMDSNQIASDSNSEGQNTGAGFGIFKVRLADLLTLKIILELATFFEYPPTCVDELERENSRGLLMVRLMEERGQIRLRDITPLTRALRKRGLLGIESSVRKMFKDTTGLTCPESYDDPQSNGNKDLFTGYLKKMYRQLYNKIQPIPYIREKMYCVNDIFVEAGLEIRRGSGQQSRAKNRSAPPTERLNSYRDVFNDDVISSERIVLEGDPGYGKSTFTLQSVYDWCCDRDSSPLKNVDVLVLLPLRLLKGISSIFRAIKLLLMPGESPLTEDDIKEILSSGLSVVIILDGYDEYPDKDDGDTDVHKIIAGRMFTDFKVITCTRSACLPKELDVMTIKIRLTGFDDKARDEYINRAVVDNDEEAATRINDFLTKSPVLSDICEVPLFCVMFAHISHEEKDMMPFSSVTSFFNYMLTCFYSHMWKKPQSKNNPRNMAKIPSHFKLNKLAFESLTKATQQLLWPSDEFKDKIGEGCYNELITIGIIIEEEQVEIHKPGGDLSNLLQHTVFVRFYHKLFAEWYAANYLSLYAAGPFPLKLNQTLKKINPFELQFLLRFSCGMNKKASNRIIKYLKTIEGSDSFVSLCFFEQAGGADDVIGMVSDLCLGGVIINAADSRLLQRSNIQLLNIASSSQIPIPSLHFNQSLSKVENDTIILKSGISLPYLSTVNAIHIQTGKEERAFSEEEMEKIFNYGLKSQHLTQLSFDGPRLPFSLSLATVLDTLLHRKIKVSWNYLDCLYNLRPQSGQWELFHKSSVRQVCSGTAIISGNDDRFKVWHMTRILETASNYDIPISKVHLHYSLKTVEDNDILLSYGFSLPHLSTVKGFHIQTNGNDRRFTEKEVEQIFLFALKSDHLTHLYYDGPRLPLSFAYIPDGLQERNIKVTWLYLDCLYCLDLPSRQWQIYDKNTVQQKCSGTITFDQTDTKFEAWHRTRLLETASQHEIPITRVEFNHSLDKLQNGDIVLKSGVSLSGLASVNSIHIQTYGVDRRFTHEEMEQLFFFALKSQTLRSLSFDGSILPRVFSCDVLLERMRDRNLEVSWRYADRAYRMDLQSGRWKIRSKDSVQQFCSDTVIISDNDNEFKVWNTAKHLETASAHDIPIPCLKFDRSLEKCEEDKLKLHTGRTLAVLRTVEQIHIESQKEMDNLKEFTEDEFAKLCIYALGSQKLKEIKFGRCLLPLTFSRKSVSDEMINRDIQVSWRPSNRTFQMNFKSSQWEVDNVNYVREMSSRTIYIRGHESIANQRSTIQMLHIAANQHIPISQLCLKESFSEANSDGLILRSRLCLPCHLTVKSLLISTQEGHEISEEEAARIWLFVIQSQGLMKLVFDGCLLPVSIPVNSIPDEMKARDMTVLWTTYGYQLTLQSGLWKVNDIQTFRDLCSETIYINENDSHALQECTIQLLNNASDNSVTISCLYLLCSLEKVDGDFIILHSGMRLECPLTMNALVISTPKGREMTEAEIVGILTYVQRSQSLQKLEFRYCLLPRSIPVESIPPTLRSRNVEVSVLMFFGGVFDLCLHSGKFVHERTRRTLTERRYAQEVQKFRGQWSNSDDHNRGGSQQ